MEIILEELKKIIAELIKNPFEELYHEIIEYFEMLPNLYYEEDRKKLLKSEKQILESYGLIHINLKDSLFLPEIIRLAEEIKENNFNLFNKGWNTRGYYHYEHAYKIKGIIRDLEPLAEIIDKFRSKYSVKKASINKIDFVDIQFKDFDLLEFDEFKEAINKTAEDKILFRTLPILLRTIFENLLWYIFKDGLASRYTILFFNPNKNRIRDFSQLILLLNELKDHEIIPFSKNAINSKVIEKLNEIKKFGNWNVHEIHSHVNSNFVRNWKEDVNHLVKALLLLYKNIRGKNLEIDEKRLNAISKKLGLEKKNKINHTIENDLVKIQSQEKELDVSINGSMLIPGYNNKFYIGVKAVNKSVRPIIINSYGFELLEEEYKVVISPFHPEHRLICTPLPCKLQDGEDCHAFISREAFEDMMNEHGWNYPLKIRGFFHSNDGVFYSEPFDLLSKKNRF
ncbi:MAG: hypothetical protein ACFFCE_16700 [Promethearchaeota archaeon]